MILTFYSYKGGVGRSMALANVARWFQLQGLRVIMVDWDLEAPGLESFFGADATEKQALQGKLGLLELLISYKDIFSGLPSVPPVVAPVSSNVSPKENDAADPEKRAALRLEDVVGMLQDVLPPLSHFLVPIKFPSDAGASAGSLSLLPAGARGGDRFSRYAENVQSFDWSKFYSEYEGEAYFEWMRRQLTDPNLADVVLIDSRTGVAEMSGVCTRQLADVVVMLCAPNDQNLDGVQMMARSFTRPDLLHARAGRPLYLVMTPSRVDIAEGKVVDVFQDRFRRNLNQFIPQPFLSVGIGFEKLRIPYVREYAYSERLAIGDPEGFSDLQKAYITLAAHVAFLAPPASPIRRQCRETLQSTFGLTTVYVGFAEKGDEPLARDLDARLSEAGIITVLGDDGAVPTTVPASASRFGGLVLALGPSGLRQERVAAAWWFARENGICLYFIAPDPNRVERPTWARRVRIFNAAQETTELIHLAQSPCQTKRIPLMAPPHTRPILGRDVEISRVRDLLLSKRSRPVALVGPGGAGKTAVAQAVCRDADILDTFDGGILWASMGSGSSLAASLGSMLTAVTGDSTVPGTPEECSRKLIEALSGRNCLIVCDDLTDAEQLRYLPQSEFARLLLTTRFRGIATIDADTVEIGPLSDAAARDVLLAGLDVSQSLASAASDFTRVVGNVPLALELANATIRARGGSQKDVVAALGELRSAVRGEGLDALESAGTGVVGPSASLLSAFSAALERLNPRERALLPLLARLPVDTDFSLADAAEALGATQQNARGLLLRLASMSVIQQSPDELKFRIPALAREYFRSLEQRKRRVDSSREASGDASGIFISYNRGDSSAIARRVYSRLAAEFGPDRVFMDVFSIAPGEDFVQRAQQAIESSSVIIALIGPRWAEMLGQSESMSLELARSLQRNRPVIPVLVDGASFPPTAHLPPELAMLERRQGLSIDNLSFNQNVDELIDAVRNLTGAKEPSAVSPTASAPARGMSRRQLLLAGASAVAGLSGAAVVFSRLAKPDPVKALAQQGWTVTTDPSGVHLGRLLPIPPESASSLVALQPNSLTLSGNVTDLSPLRGLISLTSLSIRPTRDTPLQNPLSAQALDLSPLGGITELRNLELISPNVSNISPLGNLTKLIGLNLSFTHMRDISSLQELKALKSLMLNGTDIVDISPLRGLTSLVTLSIDNTKVTDLSPLNQLKSLVVLSVRGLPAESRATLALRSGLTVTP